MDDDEVCLGPPCRHFPDWVKTSEDALDYLAYQALRDGAATCYVAQRDKGPTDV